MINLLTKRSGIAFLGLVLLTRCGDQTGTNTTTTTPAETPGTFSLASDSLPEGQEFKSRYVFGGVGGCGGENVSPQLSWSNAPTSNVKSLALTMLDSSFDNVAHWIVYNIPTTATSLSEGASSKNLPTGSLEGPNLFGSDVSPAGSYGGPCPPVGEVHTYQFKIWALDIADLKEDTNINFSNALSVIEGIDRHDVSSATLDRKFTGPP